jgi:MoxR-like ATPase
MGYPGRLAEIDMLEDHAAADPVVDLGPVADANDVVQLVDGAREVHVAKALRAYIVDLAEATRRHPRLTLGASPRAALAVQRTARSWAASEGRDFAAPDDVKAIAGPVLEHRLLLTPEAELDGLTAADILEEVLSKVSVPSARG